MTSLVSFAAVQQLFAVFGVSAALVLEALLIVIVVVRDMKTVLKSTNDNAITGDRNKLKVLKTLKEFIELHAMLKKLSVHNYLCFFC